MQPRSIAFLERACTVGGLLLLAGAGCFFDSGGVPIAADSGAADAALVERLGFAFPSGMATLPLLSKLERLQKIAFASVPPFGVPTSLKCSRIFCFARWI